ncbi:PKD domain-containing protein [Bacteroides sp.]
MNKFNNITSVSVFVILALTVGGIILGIRSCQPGPTVKAFISNTDVTLGESFTYSDSTKNAEEWYWEFGDNGTSAKARGNYTYKQAGKYRIRLTVNGKYEKLFTVNVKAVNSDSLSRLVEIEAPKTAMQGEYIVFKGVGNDKQWRWEFGESGIVDAREKSPIYAYSEPGTYRVQLRTENTQYPVIHNIEIIPNYSKNDSTDMMSVIGADIREKLQAISNGKSFNANYGYIIRKYMCADEKTEVVINNNKLNDIYSYCQGLAATGKGRNILIDHVAVEIPDLESGCVTKIIVVQTGK